MPRRGGKNGATRSNETAAQKYARSVSGPSQQQPASLPKLAEESGDNGDNATSTLSSQVETDVAVDGAGLSERQEPEPGPSSRPASWSGRAKDGVDNGVDDDNNGDHSNAAEDNDDEEEEDEDEEPTLRYRRLTSRSITEVFARDSCSAIAVSSKYLVLGTHSGGVVVLARAGTVVKDKGKGKEVEKLDDASIHEDDEGAIVVKRYRPHTASVLDIVIDEDSQYIGTASMDGACSHRSWTSSSTDPACRQGHGPASGHL